MLRKVKFQILSKKQKNFGLFIAIQFLIALVLIFIVGYTFFSFYRIAREDAIAIGEKAVYEVSEKLNSFLSKGLDVLSVSGDSVSFMMKNGDSDELIKKYLESTTYNYRKNTDESFTGIYGWINNNYMDGTGWILDKSYFPKSRDWYINAIRAKGKPVIIPPHIDVQSGKVIISVSKMLDDYMSVIAIDVAMDDMQTFASEISLNGEGYGFILDKNSLIVAHTDIKERGKNILKDDSISSDIKNLVGNIISADKKEYDSVQKRNFEVRINNCDCIAFSQNVLNDWYVVMIINTDTLFKKIQVNILWIMIFMIFIITFILYYCWQIFLGKVNLESELEIERKKLNEKTKQIISMQTTIIDEMATLIEARDVNTGNHVMNTKTYSQMIAQKLYLKKMYKDEITRGFIKRLGYAAPLHDVGKITISDSILMKKGKLDDFEYESMKNHTRMGGAIIRNMFKNLVDQDTVQMAVEVAQYHHERWDGKGYPVGLSGEEIPLCARILAIADCFDALVSKRVYKASMTSEEAFNLIKSEAGTHFDPVLVEVFLSLKVKVNSYLEHGVVVNKDAFAKYRIQ